MNFRYLLASFLFITQMLWAQEGIAVYTDYLSDNYFLLHPSMAGSATCAKLRFTGRQQWTAQNDAPELQTLSYHMSMGERSGIGAILFNDKNGYHSQKGVKLSYAHHLPLIDGPVLNQLSFGISTGLIQSSLDRSKFNPIYDPVTQAGGQLSNSYFNIDAGFSYHYKNLYAHATAKNVISNQRRLYTDIESDNLRKYLLSVGYVFGEEETFQIEPSVLFQFVEKTGESFADLNIKLYKQFSSGMVWGALSYRRSIDGAEYGINNNQKLQNLTPVVGFNYKNMMVAYTYTAFIGDIQFAKGGFYQITLGLDILCKRPHYNCFCPAVN